MHWNDFDVAINRIQARRSERRIQTLNDMADQLEFHAAIRGLKVKVPRVGAYAETKSVKGLTAEQVEFAKNRMNKLIQEKLAEQREYKESLSRN